MQAINIFSSSFASVLVKLEPNHHLEASFIRFLMRDTKIVFLCSNSRSQRPVEELCLHENVFAEIPEGGGAEGHRRTGEANPSHATRCAAAGVSDEGRELGVGGRGGRRLQAGEGIPVCKCPNQFCKTSVLSRQKQLRTREAHVKTRDRKMGCCNRKESYWATCM